MHPLTALRPYHPPARVPHIVSGLLNLRLLRPLPDASVTDLMSFGGWSVGNQSPSSMVQSSGADGTTIPAVGAPFPQLHQLQLRYMN